MNRVILKITLFGLFFACLISCRGSWQSVFEGRPEEVKKIQKILHAAGVSFRIKGTTEKQAILTQEKDAQRLVEPLRRLESLLALSCRPGSSLEEYFLPVNNPGKVSYGKSLSKFLISLDAINGIFTVSCAVRSDVDRLGGKILTVWHDFPEESGIDQLKANVFTNAETLGLNLGEQIIFRRIPWENSNSQGHSDEPKSNLNLIVFEPFSFRVLNSEKSIAGIQFLVMLVLFLISGFTLGYWWGRR